VPWQYRFTIFVSSLLFVVLKIATESALVGGPKVYRVSRVSAAVMWLLRSRRKRAAAKSVSVAGAGGLAGWIGGLVDCFGGEREMVGADGALGGVRG